MFICFTIVGYRLPIISEIGQNSQAATAGFQVEDEIVAVDGKNIHTDLDFSAALMFKPQLTPSVVTVKRDGKNVDLKLVPEVVKRPMLGISMTPTSDGLAEVVLVDENSNQGNPVLAVGDVVTHIGGIPVSVENIGTVLEQQAQDQVELTVLREDKEVNVVSKLSLIETVNPLGIQLTRSTNLWRGIPYSFQYSWSVLRTTGQGLVQLIAGKLAPQDALAGPVGIVTMISGVVTDTKVSVADKVVELLQLFALISLSIGFTNLLPIPLLDGNQLLLLIVEGIRGKRLSYKAQSLISVIGVILLLGLFGMALFFDLSRLLQ